MTTAPIKTFKMPFRTTHFNINQRVWIVSLSGDMAALCCGKFRGKHRYVRAWVNWSGKNRQNPEIQEFDVSAEFWTRINGIDPDPRYFPETTAPDPSP